MKTSSATIVSARDLSKTFAIQKPRKTIGEWFSPAKNYLTAVSGINLSIETGDSVAFIGPNGAGKSTTIKMLSGILSSSAGTIEVCGLDPIKHRSQLSYSIGCVFGQRSQLLPNIPLSESLLLFGRMYNLTKKTARQRCDELVALFNLESLISRPVRELSLGQRMRGEIAASLMHSPRLIFLDEPTIGLDISAKKLLRQTLQDLNTHENTTIFLTSHDTGDIEALARRTIIIDTGKIILDIETEELKKNFLNEKQITVTFESLYNNVPNDFREQLSGNTLELAIDTSTSDLGQILLNITRLGVVQDISIHNRSLEDTILKIYQENS